MCACYGVLGPLLLERRRRLKRFSQLFTRLLVGHPSSRTNQSWETIYEVTPGLYHANVSRTLIVRDVDFRTRGIRFNWVSPWCLKCVHSFREVRSASLPILVNALSPLPLAPGYVWETLSSQFRTSARVFCHRHLSRCWLSQQRFAI